MLTKVKAGTADVINKKIGMVAMKTAPGSYSIFEIKGKARPQWNDRLEWDAAHPTAVRNLTRKESYVVMMQDHDLPEDGIRERLLMRPRRK